MLIFQEKEFRLVEMAKVKDFDTLPKSILKRTRRLVVDEWWEDKNERNDHYKIGMNLLVANRLNPFQGLSFDYGFMRAYKNARQGKSTGADNDPKFEFRALHLISTIPGAEGQWYRDNFKDEDFEELLQYEHDTIPMNSLNDSKVMQIVRELKLKSAMGTNMNILSILDRLLK